MAKINHNISLPNDGLGDQLRTAFDNQNAMNTELYANKVDAVAGEGLSENNFTDEDRIKLDAIAVGAGVQIQSDWEQADILQKDFIKNKPVEMFSSIGSFHYVDSATKTTPLSVLLGVEKKITNDTLDPLTNILNAPYGITSMWNTVNDQLNFTQTSIGDLITLIPAIEITTTVANQEFQIYAKLGIGSDTPTTVQIYRGALKTVGSIIVNATRDFTIDTLGMKDFPGEIFILSDANASVKSGALDIRVVRKNVNVVTDHVHTNLTLLETLTTTLKANWDAAYSWVTTNGANVLAHIANKQNSLAADGTGVKYPTVDAVNASVNAIYDWAVGLFISGSGTQNYLPKFGVGGKVVGDSQIVDDGTNVGIGTVPTHTLTVQGALGIIGTAGAGYIDIKGQSVEPVVPVAGTVRLHGETTDARTFPEFTNESGTMVVLGRDSIVIAKNVSGGAITKGQAIYVFGSSGNTPTVKLAKSDAAATILGTIGIVAETTIADNGFGHIVITGVIKSINTSAYTAGDGLYVSATTAGILTNISPAYPNFQKKIGTVMNVGVGNGSMLINTAPFTGGMEVGTNATNFIFGGDVGFGKITPTEKVDVVGNGLFSGTLNASNLSGTNTGDQTLAGLGGAPASGSANYIQNQNASAQSANIWISGNGRFGGNLETNSITPSIDVLSTIGTSNSFIALGNNIGFIGTNAEGTKVYYSGSTGNTFFDSYYSAGSIIFRNNVSSGSPIISLILASAGAATFASTIKAASSVQVGDNTAVASAALVGATRYRVSGNNSYAEMCMQTGASTYEWTTLTVHSW